MCPFGTSGLLSRLMFFTPTAPPTAPGMAPARVDAARHAGRFSCRVARPVSATTPSNPAAVSLVSRLMTLSPLSRLVEALCHRPSQVARAGCQACSPSYPSSRASLVQNVGAVCQHQKRHIFVQRFLALVSREARPGVLMPASNAGRRATPPSPGSRRERDLGLDDHRGAELHPWEHVHD